MLSQNVLRQNARSIPKPAVRRLILGQRALHNDGRNRLSNFWTPTERQHGSPEASKPENKHGLLIRAGFLRQAHSGIFHLLPLGLRVQDKIERLIDKHMQQLGASKVSLSCISSEELWQRSGRLDKGRGSELLRFEDRKGAKYLLSPTHEEEITTIVANAVHSYKQLPLRLYQISRKYRDEPRPRQGLLRGREFLMKDLYTFDATEEQARMTYEDVRTAYAAFLDELKLPYLVARADSGNIGGTLSHEYHFPYSQGEDTVIECNTCEYSVNEELYIGRYNPKAAEQDTASQEFANEFFVSKDRSKSMTVFYPTNRGGLNIYAVKAIFPDVDPSIRGDDARKEHISSQDSETVEVYDPRLLPDHLWRHSDESIVNDAPLPVVDGKPILLTKARRNDSCPNCQDGKLKSTWAVEIGHTFHLGTRYSIPLEASVLDTNGQKVPIEMGCHGIGVSRLIGAVAALLADPKGLNWPLAIAPFEVVMVATDKVDRSEFEVVYDTLSDTYEGDQLDVVMDDRDRPLGWKLNDADLVGYPFVVVLGNDWSSKGLVELQCRRLGIKEKIPAKDLTEKILDYGERM